jgi:ppGpp synthetase/RelA/SpoT-type nucleotidyltranferase
MDVTAWTKRYGEERPQYERLSAKACQLLRDILRDEGVSAECVYRAKDVESFQEKIARTGKDYRDPLREVTDLAGVRVIVQSLEDVERVGNIIVREFSIDELRSVNKLHQLEPDRFGYLSQHFIVRLANPRSQLSEWKGLGDRWVEVQVRTTLQHAWAVIQHSLDYKSEIDVPTKLRRRLFRVSALLEIADEELDVLGREIGNTIREYKEMLARGDAHIELNGDSLRTYVKHSSEVAYWCQYLREQTRQRVERIGDVSRDVRLARFLGLSRIEEIDRLLHNSRGWGEIFLAQYFQKYFQRNNLTPDRVSTDINGVVTLLMIGTYAHALTPQVLSRDFGFGTSYILDVANASRPTT